LTLFLIATTGWPQNPRSKEEKSYMPAIRQELARLDLEARCDDATSSCWYNRSLDEEKGPVIKIVIHYSQQTNTIYIYIDKFIALGENQGPSLELARQLLKLNRELVTAKFEWDKPTDSVRLSATVNTDSNFDRRAFRSQLTGLLAVARKVWPTLNAYAKGQPEALMRVHEALKEQK
jgi:hypothetical protein